MRKCVSSFSMASFGARRLHGYKRSGSRPKCDPIGRPGTSDLPSNRASKMSGSAADLEVHPSNPTACRLGVCLRNKSVAHKRYLAASTEYQNIQQRIPPPSFRCQFAVPVGRSDSAVHQEVASGDERTVRSHKERDDDPYLIGSAGTPAERRSRGAIQFPVALQFLRSRAE